MGKAGALGILGGSGLYEIDGLQNTRWERVSSPFGEPSDDFFFGELDGRTFSSRPRSNHYYIVVETITCITSRSISCITSRSVNFSHLRHFFNYY